MHGAVRRQREAIFQRWHDSEQAPRGRLHWRQQRFRHGTAVERIANVVRQRGKLRIQEPRVRLRSEIGLAPAEVSAGDGFTSHQGLPVSFFM